MTTNKPTPELKTFPQPKTIYRCDNCGKQGTPETCCNGWRMSEYTRSDFITRPAELRQAGVDGKCVCKDPDTVFMHKETAMSLFKCGPDNDAPDMAKVERITKALQPAAQKTEGAGEVEFAVVIEKFPKLKPWFLRLANTNIGMNTADWSQFLHDVAVALASRASVDVGQLKREIIAMIVFHNETCAEDTMMDAFDGARYAIDHLAAKFPELVGGRDAQGT